MVTNAEVYAEKILEPEVEFELSNDFLNEVLTRSILARVTTSSLEDRNVQ